MKFLKKKQSVFFRITKVQDFVVVFSLFIFSAILLLGLFPRSDASERAGRLFFIYTMMAIPVIVAIYFIIISFRRKISKDTSYVDTSIKTKIALAFLFVAIIPSMPIVLISNNVINRAIAELISTETSYVMDKAIEMSNDSVYELSDSVRKDLQWIKYSLDNNIFDLKQIESRQYITEILRKRGLVYKCFQILKINDLESELIDLPGDAGKINYSEGVKEYLSLLDYSDNTFISKISVEKSLILLGGYKVGSILSVFYRVVPEKFYSRVAYFAHAKKRYDQKIFLRPYIQSFTGLMLFVLSLGVVVIAIGISLLLSKNITKPVLELEESARQVAAGDFSIRLYRTASDELTLLYDSFNTMVRQLNESRKAMFHMQKIKAWGEVGNKLLHEIKNPLTPIKLSAERMRKRFVEKHENIEKIILNGTETIIEEVASLQHILAEFSQFARLPKVKLSKHDINSIVKNCINMFLGHDNISFVCEYDEKIPEIMVDRILLRQSLVNILKNAVEAIVDSGTIEVSTGKNSENYLFITIKDSGYGINSEDIEKLFEPTFSKKENGNGLGLAIVEKIILEHKGRITCQSKENEGTTFILELPIDN